MERVRGIGGIFFKARDKAALEAWYRDHLGVPVEKWGGASFVWHEHDAGGKASTAWSPFAADAKYFPNSFMINFRVDNLDAMLAQLRAMGDAVDEKIDDSEYGRFGWVTDPEGNRIELWQPPSS